MAASGREMARPQPRPTSLAQGLGEFGFWSGSNHSPLRTTSPQATGPKLVFRHSRHIARESQESFAGYQRSSRIRSHCSPSGHRRRQNRLVVADADAPGIQAVVASVQSFNRTHVGAWSLAAGWPRTHLSTPASTRRGFSAGLSSR